MHIYWFLDISYALLCEIYHQYSLEGKLMDSTFWLSKVYILMVIQTCLVIICFAKLKDLHLPTTKHTSLPLWCLVLCTYANLLQMFDNNMSDTPASKLIYGSLRKSNLILKIIFGILSGPNANVTACVMCSINKA